MIPKYSKMGAQRCPKSTKGGKNGGPEKGRKNNKIIPKEPAQAERVKGVQNHQET